MKYSIIFSILIVTLNSCGSPSVVEELSNEQVLELIQTDEGYEDIIRQLKSVNYLFEKDVERIELKYTAMRCGY